MFFETQNRKRVAMKALSADKSSKFSSLSNFAKGYVNLNITITR
jgi:hypothetical protein